jgi:hypothetical protein
MAILKITPDYVVNTDLVESAHYETGTDKFQEKHVLVNFKDYGHDIDPEYTLEEITAAMNGLCYYREQWTDEVGNIEVCVLHGNNSKHNPAVHGKFRLCLTQDPYVTYSMPSLTKTRYEPSIEHSWEYTEHERRKQDEAELRNERDPLESRPGPLSPVAEYLSSGNASLSTYTPPPPRPWWKRIFGIY